MIFAAGMGTRLKPLTDIVPKAMLPVQDKPLLQHVLENVAADPDSLVVINVHHHARQIINFIDMQPLTPGPYRQEILGYSLMNAMGIKSEEFNQAQ